MPHSIHEGHTGVAFMNEVLYEEWTVKCSVADMKVDWKDHMMICLLLITFLINYILEYNTDEGSI